MDADVIVYAVIAAALGLWLRSLLGTRGADEPTRPNPFVGAGRQRAAETGENAGRPAAGACPRPCPATKLAPNMAVNGQPDGRGRAGRR